MFSLAFVSRMQ